jgi:hypothetical protein
MSTALYPARLRKKTDLENRSGSEQYVAWREKFQDFILHASGVQASIFYEPSSISFIIGGIATLPFGASRHDSGCRVR